MSTHNSKQSVTNVPLLVSSEFHRMVIKMRETKFKSIVAHLSILNCLLHAAASYHYHFEIHLKTKREREKKTQVNRMNWTILLNNVLKQTNGKKVQKKRMGKDCDVTIENVNATDWWSVVKFCFSRHFFACLLLNFSFLSFYLWQLIKW